MGTVDTLCELISDGCAGGELEYDDLSTLIDHVNQCAKRIKQQRGAEVAMKLRPGTNVRISMSANLTPRYILGTHAKVVKVNRTSATIELGHVASPTDNSRFYTGQKIRCPLDALEVVEAG